MSRTSQATCPFAAGSSIRKGSRYCNFLNSSVDHASESVKYSQIAQFSHLDLISKTSTVSDAFKTVVDNFGQSRNERGCK